MLKGLNPLLGPDLLATLCAMGHGDEIAVVDANFPAQATARRLLRADGIDAVAMVRAVVSVLPLDDFSPSAAFRMAVVDAPDAVPAVVSEFDAELVAAGYEGDLVALERHAFYERARSAFAIIATGELRLYGNLILVKGVVRPGRPT
jgi:L-fucose mutarotase